ncbi:hypothetical protein MCP1_130067 [Candidatus Terasakiella magnetica]|nr:hypothetical protein MCP1_130067 [Candidatus Terasakiella magnetica]
MTSDLAQDRPTILVVDDTPDNLTILGEILEPYYRVRIAPSGQRALEIAVTDPRPNLILLDVMMPGVDGFECLRCLRHVPEARRIPVIFVTAMDATEDEERWILRRRDYPRVSLLLCWRRCCLEMISPPTGPSGTLYRSCGSCWAKPPIEFIGQRRPSTTLKRLSFSKNRRTLKPERYLRLEDDALQRGRASS